MDWGVYYFRVSIVMVERDAIMPSRAFLHPNNDDEDERSAGGGGAVKLENGERRLLVG